MPQSSTLISFVICGVVLYYWKFFIVFAFFITSIIFGVFLTFLFFGTRWQRNQQTINIVKSTEFRPHLSELVGEKRTFLCDRFDYFVITGSSQIDDLIHQIIDNLIRSYIDPWYCHLSSNRSFPNSLKRCACRTLAMLSERLKRVDWTVLLTRHMVDDVASHFRLFRLSKERQMEHTALVKDGVIKKAEDIESLFFDMELEMEVMYCRDLISTSPAYESACLHDITDILLFLLMPCEDFRSRPLRFLLREILIGRVFIPLLNKICDSDFINYCIVVALSDVKVTADDFLMVMKRCRSIKDLEVILEAAFAEQSMLCSRDNSINMEDTKKEIQALATLIELIKGRMRRLEKAPCKAEGSTIIRMNDTDSDRIILPITVVLTNNVAVTYFSDYLAFVGYQHYLDCYLAIEGFKSSVAHQLRAVAGGVASDPDFQETMKEASLFLYNQYLADTAPSKIPLSESMVNTFLVRMRNDEPSDSWFDHIQTEIVNILTSERIFYDDFTRSQFYLKMLGHLEIFDIDKTGIADGMDSEDYLLAKGCRLFVEVEMLGIGRQNKGSGAQFYAVYNIKVRKTDKKGDFISSWNVIRRYSDFFNFNSIIQSKYPMLKRIDFPAKKTFNNLKQKFLERRCSELNKYMEQLTDAALLNSIPGLPDDLLDFLNQKRYIGISQKLPKKIVLAMMTPIIDKVKAFKSAVTNVPDHVTKMGNEINRAASTIMRNNSLKHSATDFRRVAASLDLEGGDGNIPLRVLLLFVNELFGLDGRNQWFKSRVIAAIRHFLHAAFGTSLNKMIVDFVEEKSSEQSIAKYLTLLRNTLQTRRPTDQHRHNGAKGRVLSQMLMYAALPSELKFVFGATSSFNAVSNFSEMIHQKSLNRRFCYVIIERLLLTLFPEGNFPQVLARLHSKSPRFIDV